jgi:DNA-binding NarL/FixJ family response regulator
MLLTAHRNPFVLDNYTGRMILTTGGMTSATDRSATTSKKMVALLGFWPALAERHAGPEVGRAVIIQCPEDVVLLRRTALQWSPSWLILGQGMKDDILGSLSTVVQLVKPTVRVAVLGDAEDSERCDRWLARGATAYLRSTVRPIEALHILSAAEDADVVVIDRGLRRLTTARQAQLRLNLMSAQSALTKREREVLELIRLGMRNSDIASSLKVTGSAVEFHVSNILSKLEVANRTEAVVRANALGM